MTEFTRISFLIEDRHVMTIERVLLSYRAKQLVAQPVFNAEEAENGEIVAKVAGDPIDMMRVWIKAKRLKVVRSNDMREFQLAHGRAPGGYSAILRRAVDEGLLRRVRGTKGQNAAYDVVPPRKPKPKAAKKEVTA